MLRTHPRLFAGDSIIYLVFSMVLSCSFLPGHVRITRAAISKAGMFFVWIRKIMQFWCLLLSQCAVRSAFLGGVISGNRGSTGNMGAGFVYDICFLFFTHNAQFQEWYAFPWRIFREDFDSEIDTPNNFPTEKRPGSFVVTFAIVHGLKPINKTAQTPFNFCRFERNAFKRNEFSSATAERMVGKLLAHTVATQGSELIISKPLFHNFGTRGPGPNPWERRGGRPKPYLASQFRLRL